MRVVTFALLSWLCLISSSWATTVLRQKSLIVSNNAFTVQSGKVGVNVSTPSAFFEVRSITSNAVLMAVTSTGLGVGTANPTQIVEVVGSMNMRRGTLIYTDSTTGQTNKDWRLVRREKITSTTDWTASSGAAATVAMAGQTIVKNATGGSYIYKNYTLPVHNYVKVLAEFYALDNWTGGTNDGYVVATDGSVAPTVLGSTVPLMWTSQYYKHSNSSVLYYDYGSTASSADSLLLAYLQGHHTNTLLRVFVGSTAGAYGIGSIEIWIKN